MNQEASVDDAHGGKRMILIGGGARSGKSAFALRRAATLGERRVFVATARAVDEEMAQRIARHRAERGAGFTTIEEPLELASALAGLRAVDVVVVDCVTVWLANLLLREESEQRILTRVDALVDELSRRAYGSVLVSNEVGMSVVPETALGRAFRDLTGFAHQRLARAADEVYLGVLGAMLRIKPGAVVHVPLEGAPDGPAG
jgi:adenosylcobinamide kinase/adenosylcobinamide-phosphate guanylyltransferase